MTQHDDLLYLGHMLDVARDALAIGRGKSADDLSRDRTAQFAVAYALQIIGEAARSVSAERKAGMPDVPWTKIIGMRHRLVHNYSEIDLKLVSDTVAYDLEPLIRALEKVVPESPP